MRNLRILIIGLLLVLPALVLAGADDLPGNTTWYFHVDLKEMKSDEVGKALYGWLDDEAFADVREDTGVDIGEELEAMTAFSVDGQGLVMSFDADLSQESRDIIMALIAAEGDLQPKTASGIRYYRFSGQGDSAESVTIDGRNIEIQLDSLEDEAWISMDLKNQLLVTSSEDQMKAMLKNGGKIPGRGSHDGALLILTADKTLLQAGMNSVALGEDDDGDSDWDSNILRNTEQVAFLVAAAANKLAIEAKLVTTEPEVALSLASVVRGLMSLMALSGEMDAEVVAMMQGTKIEADGRNLNISLAINPDLVISTLSE